MNNYHAKSLNSCTIVKNPNSKTLISTLCQKLEKPDTIPDLSEKTGWWECTILVFTYLRCLDWPDFYALWNRWDEEPRNCRRYFSHSGGLHYHGSSCRSSYFRCRDKLGCVAPTFVCDGEDDCSDGSDEWNCGSDDDCDSYNEFQVSTLSLLSITSQISLYFPCLSSFFTWGVQ